MVYLLLCNRLPAGLFLRWYTWLLLVGIHLQCERISLKSTITRNGTTACGTEHCCPSGTTCCNGKNPFSLTPTQIIHHLIPGESCCQTGYVCSGGQCINPVSKIKDLERTPLTRQQSISIQSTQSVQSVASVASASSQVR